MVCKRMHSGDQLSQPAVGVYVGQGASHSWTWFADIFERAGYYSVSFLNEKDIADRALSGCDVFFISGGDTFAIAEGLGNSGAQEIKNFVANGGIYVGSCAGAYLPLKSSLSPLNRFNFVNARISNLTGNLPAPKKKAEKFCTAYGCRYVYHPVREEIIMTVKGPGNGKQRSIRAPLFGGPALLPSEDIEVLAEYAGLTKKTELLVDEDIARKTIIGHVAAARKKSGKGMFYILGPHFEHPDYPEANKFIFQIMFQGRKVVKAENYEQPAYKRFATDKNYLKFMSQISNARIVALALERTSYKWLIGKKVYDPEKIRVFLETIWQRAQIIKSSKGYKYISEHEMAVLMKYAEEITVSLRRLKKEAVSDRQGTKAAAALFVYLREATAKFLAIYFRLMRQGLTGNERGLQCTYTSKQPQHFIH